MARFLQTVQQKFGSHIYDYLSLHQWSVTQPADFWKMIWDYCEVKASKPADTILVKGQRMQDTKWFVGAQLNFAENLMKHNDDHIALIFASEHGHRAQITYRELFQQVAAVANHLKKIDVKVGDRVAGYLSNSIETVVAMLATTSIGAIWSSCSADFGLQGLLDRFGQIEPKILFAVDGHYYNGKTFHHLELIRELQTQLPTLKETIIVSYVESTPKINELKNSILFSKIIAEATKTPSLEFAQLPFNHPIYILYTSGTTGKPKCMVHGAGGTLLQHLKELMLHTNLHPEDKIFFYTTCGWMMWNWLVSSLAVGATLVLYDGSPLYPKQQSLFDLINEVGITIFGTSAKFLESVENSKLEPINTHRLTTLHSILTTGSSLLPESFDYVYQKIKKNVRLSSISGGTDIVSCFALGNPILPVYRGELQCLGLGMDMKVFDEHGHPIIGEKGELVCVSPFPCMPIYFWNDPDGSKYENAYFTKYPHVWTHGDYALLNEHGGLVIYGRSDATLNPGGVRVGTAEIYSQVKKFEEIIDYLAVGQTWNGGERIILFVKLRNEASLTPELIAKIKSEIKKNVSPHHVPAKIIAVADLPRTISGKIVEIAVRKVIHNEPIKNVEALANPESLEYFRNLPELTTK